jgi:hypothetical protein
LSVLLAFVSGKPPSFETGINTLNMRVVREHHVSRSISCMLQTARSYTVTSVSARQKWRTGKYKVIAMISLVITN